MSEWTSSLGFYMVLSSFPVIWLRRKLVSCPTRPVLLVRANLSLQFPQFRTTGERVSTPSFKVLAVIRPRFNSGSSVSECEHVRWSVPVEVCMCDKAFHWRCMWDEPFSCRCTCAMNRSRVGVRSEMHECSWEPLEMMHWILLIVHN